MARIAVLSDAAILDTSLLLELYRVPGYFRESRTLSVRTQTDDLVKAKCEVFVTVPVLFEVASHTTHARDGRRRRTLGKNLRDDVTNSIDRESPWTITTGQPGFLFRSQDVIQLAERILESSGPNYSFDDISIIDLAAELRQPGPTAKILAFDEQLLSYSD